jgi:hypothetical protein
MRPVRAIFTTGKIASLTVLVGKVDSSQSQERTVWLVWMAVCGLGNLASLHESEKGFCKVCDYCPRDSLNMTEAIGTRDPQCWNSVHVCEYSRIVSLDPSERLIRLDLS